MVKHGEVGKSAMLAAMSENTARKYLEAEKLPSEMQGPRHWRTREDPFSDDWEEMVQLFKDVLFFQWKEICHEP